MPEAMAVACPRCGAPVGEWCRPGMSICHDRDKLWQASARPVLPPDGEGWMPLPCPSMPTIAWAEIRRFGNKLYGRMLMEPGPAVFIGAFQHG